MKHIIFLYIMACGLFLSGCQEFERGIPINENDTAPDPISNVKVENIPGGAVLSYVLPQNENLLYVLAEYSIRDGIILEKKSSYYNNSITIKGFPDTRTYEVQLYAVSQGGKKSEPNIVTINPLKPPILSTFESLSARPTFGGVNIGFRNESEAELRIVVLTTDSLGEIYTADTYYTKRKEGDFSVRGFAAESRRFGFYVADRWNNFSDTLFVELTPYFEEQLKKPFKAINFASDTNQPHSNFKGLEALWDEIWNVGNPVFHTKPNTGIPQWFTFDLGVTAKLSRFKFYHRASSGTDGQYNAGDPEIFEIYGSNNPSDSWDSWTLLGRFQSIKPSGLPDGQYSSEDVKFAVVDGEDFEFSLDIPSVRYLRWKTLKNWGNVTYIYISELTFWGEIIH